MSATADQELAELRRANAELLKERDAVVETLKAENEELRAAQAAGLEVLQAMVASLGDTQPVFDLIARKAADLCAAKAAAVAIYDGAMLHLATQNGYDPAFAKVYATQFPRPVAPDTVMGRTILNRRVEQIENIAAEPAYGMARAPGHWSTMAVPLLRTGTPLGVIAVGRPIIGRFPENQVTLLKTFAEQAVIAIASAETYRDLQARTADLQESLEYQTATSDVLKVISSSSFALEPVFRSVVYTAVRLCHADQAVIYRVQDGAFRWAAGTDMLPEYERIERGVAIRPGPGTLIGRVALEARPVQILDAWTDPLYEVKDDARAGGVHTLLGVPLLRDGAPIGAIGLARRRVEPYTDREVELVTTFADQAVIAIENARLVAEQREALEQQTATAEVLQVINASPGDLAPVFDAMLDKAVDLCGAAFGILLTYDGERFHHVAFRSIPAAYVEFMREHPPNYGPENAPGRLALGERLVHVFDITDSDAYRSGDPNRRAIADLAGARTLVAVPLRNESKFIGAIVVFRQEVRPFSEKQISLLENFAAQAVIAMENARLITETREALEQQTAAAEVLQVINASPGNLAPVFDAVLEKAMRLCEAGFGSLYTYDGDRFQSAAQRGVPAAYAAYRERHPPELGAGLEVVVNTRRAVHVADMMAVKSYLDGNPNIRAMVNLGGIRSSVAVPLCKDGTVLGVMSVFRQEVRPFTDRQIALLENFAAQAVIAMENARLLNEVRQRQEELRITFENMGDGVAMFNEDQHLVAWNSKFQEVYDLPDALLEQHRTYEEYRRFLAERGDFGAGVDTAREIDELIASTGQPYGYERTRPDGRVIEIRRNPVPDGGFVLIFSDITERKRSEAEIRAARDAAEAAYRDLQAAQASLIQAEKMASLGQLTAGIAHEIKNPLNFVNNFASLSVDLLDEIMQTAAPGLAVLDEAHRAELDDLTSTLASNLEKINEHGRRADGIVRGMLEHSRGSSGERRQVEVNTLVDEALNLAYHGARAQDQTFSVTLQRELGEGIAPITLAPQDVTRVLLNLFSNGFYAARERQRTEAIPGFAPTLTVSTRDLDGAVEIRVHDNGIGIPPEIKDRLFQPFFTTKPPGEGTGLGLSMSYDIIIQQHGGSIRVDSKVGEYSEFTVRLPRRS
jgi:two-component system NtrC family sensor kinase